MRRVLAVGAHPDDIELGCGATLLAHSAAGDAVTMLVMTGGENGPGDDATITGRRLEQEQAARTLGARLLWGGQVDCTVTPDAVILTARPSSGIGGPLRDRLRTGELTPTSMR